MLPSCFGGGAHGVSPVHVFIYLDEERELSEDEILARVNALYRGARLEEAFLVNG